MYRDRYKVDVLFLLEHKDRELEVINEIASKLMLTYGHSSALASIIYHRIIAPILIEAKVIVFPSFGTMMNLCYSLTGDQVIYVNLNWEQMLSEINKELKKPKGFFAESILKHCAWGKDYKVYLMENSILEENIFETGKPSVFLLKKRMEKSIDIKTQISREFGLDLRRKFLFFPLTCLQAFKSDYHLKKFTEKGISIEMALERRNYVSSTLDVIFRWVDKLASNRSDINIILRPHPSVSVSQYKERFSQLLGYVPKNIIITKAHNAHDWLIASDVCFTNYSSLALDAFSVNKPTYLLEPQPFPEFLKYKWFDGFKKIANLKELQDAISTKNNNNSFSNVQLMKVYNTELNGVDKTAELLANFVSLNYKKGFRNYNKFINAVIKKPRQPLGSLIRYFLMAFNLYKLTKPGLRPDYFKITSIHNKCEAEHKLLNYSG